MLDPSGIYLFTGDFDALEKDASGLKKDAGNIRDTGGDIHSQFQGLSAYYHAPEADQLFHTTLPVRDKSKDFAGQLEKVSSALTEFASEGRPLAEKLKSLKHDAEQFLASVKDDKDWEYDKKKTDHHNRIRDDIDATVTAFQEAERRCANKITSLYKDGTHWTVDDGSHGKGMYGFKADDLKHAKVPWGEPVDQKHHWYEVGHWIKSFVWDGIVVDGIWGTVRGLGTLVGVDGWDKAGQAWTGLAKLATGLAISALPGVGPAFWSMPADKLPSWLRDSRTAVKETGKALVAWDEWSKNPARAAGGVTFNVLTTVFTGGSGTAAKAGAVAKTVSVLGKAGKFIDPMTYIGKGLGKGMSALNISVPKVGDLMAGLRDSFGGNKVSAANFSLPHDLNVHVPDAPSVPTVHDTSVKFPDGTTLHENGTMVSPAGKPHTEPIPVELNAADRIEHQQMSTATSSHAPTHVEQPVLARVGGTADNVAAHTSGHVGEAPLSSAGRGSESTAAHTGGHTAESPAHTGGSHAPVSFHEGGGTNAVSHDAGRAADGAAHSGDRAAEPTAHSNAGTHHNPVSDTSHTTPARPGHDASASGAGSRGGVEEHPGGHDTYHGGSSHEPGDVSQPHGEDAPHHGDDGSHHSHNESHSHGDHDLHGDSGDLHGSADHDSVISGAENHGLTHGDGAEAVPGQTGGSIRPPDTGSVRSYMLTEEWSSEAYGAIRAADDTAAMADHLKDVARLDGSHGFSKADIDAIKHHVFFEEHPLASHDGGIVHALYDPNPDMAEAWIRLRSGRHTDADLLLLEHELAEHQYYVDHPGSTYAEAHAAATEIADWASSPEPPAREDYTWE